MEKVIKNRKILYIFMAVISVFMAMTFASAKMPQATASGSIQFGASDGSLGDTLNLMVTHTGQDIPKEDYKFKIEYSDDKYVDPASNMPVRTDGPLPASDTISINGEGKMSFGDMKFTQNGVYCYKVTEVPGNNKNITYDNSVYHIVVYASDSEILEVVAYDDNGMKPDEIKFTDSYNPPEDEKVPPQDDDKNPPNKTGTSDNSSSSDDEGGIIRSRAQTGDYIALGAISALIISLIGFAATRRRKLDGSDKQDE